MFRSGLRSNQVWFTVALLLMSFSICPYSCYPQTEEDEDMTEVEETLDSDEDQETGHDDDDDEDLEKLDNDKDQESVHDDDDEDLEEEAEEEEDVTSTTAETAYCIVSGRPCGTSANPNGLPCCPSQYGTFYDCGILNGLNCIKIFDDEMQNELQRLKLAEFLKKKPEEIKVEKPQEVETRKKVCDWHCKRSFINQRGFRFLTPYCSC